MNDHGEVTLVEGLPDDPDDNKKKKAGRRVTSSADDAPIDRTHAGDEIPAAAPEPQTEGLPSIPELTLIRPIGQGGQGVVYEGRQEYLDRRVAVKFLLGFDTNDTFTSRFQREAKILAGMKHANIVGCYQAGMVQGHCYLVMEYIDGPNLAQWIQRNGALSVEDTLELCIHLADALDHAHAASIIHRDVKPENVLLQKDELREREGHAFPFQPKLADLGLARATTEQPGEANLTRAGAVVGSPSTMAPEQFSDPDHVDFRADIYALGCVLFHATTGRPAFKEPNITATIAKKLQGDGPSVHGAMPNLPKKYSKFVSGMMARDREVRPGSYADIIGTARGLLRELRGEPDPLKSRQRMIALSLVAATALALVVWAILASLRPDVKIVASRDSVAEGESLTLEAEVSGIDDVTVQWSQKRDDGSPLLPISDPGQNPLEIVAPAASAPYELTVELVVYQGDDPVGGDVIRIPVAAVDDPPRVTLEGPREVEEDEPICMTARVDHAEGPTTLRWSVEPAALAPDIDLTQAEIRFAAPNRYEPYELTFGVTVTDAEGNAVRESKRLRVRADDDLPIARLVAEGGRREGSEIVLSAKDSRDPDGGPLRYRIEALPGNPIEVTSDESEVRFLAPAAAAPYRLSFRAQVADALNRSEWVRLDLDIAAEDDPPEIESIDVQPTVAVEGQLLQLRARASDPEGSLLRYHWGMVEGIAVDPDTLDPAQATFPVPRGLKDSEVTIRLEVSDGTHATLRERVLPIRVDPQLLVLEAGQTQDLFAGAFGSRLDRPFFGTATGARGRWNAAQDGTGILGQCTTGASSQPLILPRGDYWIDGEMEPRPGRSRLPPDSSGVELAFARGHRLGLRWSARPAAVCEAVFMTPAGDREMLARTEGFGPDQPLAYRIIVQAESIELLWAPPGQEPAGRVRIDRAERQLEDAPATLEMFVESGNTIFGALLITGGTPGS